MLGLISILLILFRNKGSNIFCITKPNEIIPCAGDENKNGYLELKTLFPSFDAANLLLSKSRSRVSEKLSEREFCFVTLKLSIDAVFWFLPKTK